MTDNGCNLATADLFHVEIARLHGVHDLLQAEIERLRAIVFRPVTLTDAEREAVKEAAGAYGDNNDDEGSARIETALRGLLERLG